VRFCIFRGSVLGGRRAKLSLHTEALVEPPFLSGFSSSSSSSSPTTRGFSEVYQREGLEVSQNSRGLTLTAAGLTGSTWTCRVLALLKVLPGRWHAEDGLRQRSEPCEFKVAHLLIGTICRVDRVFRKLLATVFGDRACTSTCGLTETLGLL